MDWISRHFPGMRRIDKAKGADTTAYHFRAVGEAAVLAWRTYGAAIGCRLTPTGLICPTQEHVALMEAKRKELGL